VKGKWKALAVGMVEKGNIVSIKTVEQWREGMHQDYYGRGKDFLGGTNPRGAESRRKRRALQTV